MQFSDTSTRQGLVQDCEDLCNLGATGISGNSTTLQTFTRYINQWYQKTVTMILEAQDDWDFDDINKTDYPVATTPLVANQRDYTLPASLKVLKVKRVDVTYDGTNYYRAAAIDSGAYSQPLGNDTLVDAQFSTSDPRYDVKGNSIWLYPRASSSTGTLRVEFFREPTEFTTASTTAEPGFDEPFHRILSLGASFEYAMSKQLPFKQDLFTMLQDMEARLKRYYGRKNEDTVLVMKSVYDDSYGS